MTNNILSVGAGKDAVLEIAKQVTSNEKKDVIVGRYNFMGEQLSKVLITDSVEKKTSFEVLQNIMSGEANNDSYTSAYDAILGPYSYSKEELQTIRDTLIGPFASDIFMGENEDKKLDKMIKDILETDPNITTKVTMLTTDIEKAINMYAIPDSDADENE